MRISDWSSDVCSNSFVVRIHSPNNHVAIIHLIGMWDAEYHATGCCADGSGGGRRGSGPDRFGIECDREEQCPSPWESLIWCRQTTVRNENTKIEHYTGRTFDIPYIYFCLD